MREAISRPECAPSPPLLNMQELACALPAVGLALGRKAALAKILPVWLELSKEPVWNVRKACADSLPAMAAALDPGAQHPVPPVVGCLLLVQSLV